MLSSITSGPAQSRCSRAAVAMDSARRIRMRSGLSPRATEIARWSASALDGGSCPYPCTATAFAAVAIRSSVSSEWEIIAQCPLETSIVSASIR